MKNELTYTIATLALTIFLTGTGNGQEFEISRATVDGGGVMRSTNGAYELSGTIGQPDAGSMTAPGVELTGGFWFGIPPGDATDDGLVALLDYDQLEVCLSGPNTGVTTPECALFDLDGNGVVDLVDVAEFAIGFTGP